MDEESLMIVEALTLKISAQVIALRSKKPVDVVWTELQQEMQASGHSDFCKALGLAEDAVNRRIRLGLLT